MERLQAALEKARASRTGEASYERRPDDRTTRTRRPEGVDEAWAAIEEHSVGPDRMRSQRVVATSGGRDASAVDVLRTKVLQQMRQNGWRRLAVTSPGSACGKTTIVMNLAASLARQAEIRTLVLDLDLRRPSIAKLLGLRGRPSFWEVLEGKVPFAEQAVRLNDNVLVSVNTAPASNPSELLGSSGAKRRLKEIEATYQPDVILFDMPPMLVTDDNLAFVSNVDCALLVAAAESTTISQVDVCERDLSAQTNFLGVILNKCRYSAGSGYEYGY